MEAGRREGRGEQGDRGTGRKQSTGKKGEREGSKEARSQKNRVVEGGKAAMVESHPCRHSQSPCKGSAMALTAYEGLFAQVEEKPVQEGQPHLWALLECTLSLNLIQLPG